MRPFLVIGLCALLVQVAISQLPAPCLVQDKVGAQPEASPASTRRVTHPSATLSPLLSYSTYSLAGVRRYGPQLSIQASLFRSTAESFDLHAGLMFRFRDTSSPVNLDEYTPLGLRPTTSPESPGSFLKGFRLGLLFGGLEYTWYLSESDFRPYVGAGAMILGWPYQNAFAGTIAPILKGGVLARFADGVSGFLELKRIIGTPLVLGGYLPPLNHLTGFSFGMAFAPPGWN